jgi:hypothetical protein
MADRSRDGPTRCAYVARRIAVKTRYRLGVTAAERAAMRAVLVTCPAADRPAGPQRRSSARRADPRRLPERSPVRRSKGRRSMMRRTGVTVEAVAGSTASSMSINQW